MLQNTVIYSTVVFTFSHLCKILFFFIAYELSLYLLKEDLSNNIWRHGTLKSSSETLEKSSCCQYCNRTEREKTHIIRKAKKGYIQTCKITGALN